MEDRDRISDNEISRDDEEAITQGETQSVESEDYVNRTRGRRIKSTYPKPKKPDEPEPHEPEPEPPEPEPPPEEPEPDEDDGNKKSPEDRVTELERAIKGFRIESAGDGILRGGFPKLPTGAQDLMDRMANLAKAMDGFNLTGDGLSVSGSFDKGFAVSRENPCEQQQVNQNPT